MSGAIWVELTSSTGVISTYTSILACTKATGFTYLQIHRAAKFGTKLPGTLGTHAKFVQAVRLHKKEVTSHIITSVWHYNTYLGLTVKGRERDLSVSDIIREAVFEKYGEEALFNLGATHPNALPVPFKSIKPRRRFEPKRKGKHKKKQRMTAAKAYRRARGLPDPDYSPQIVPKPRAMKGD